MANNSKASSLLTKYKYLYDKNPRSKVFAPLAESYRKIGLYKEGIKILRDGIKHHPDYTLGYIVLANIYFDEGHFELAYSTVRSFISKNLENITLQKLFGKICLNLNKFDEALETYKLLLLVNPKDQEIIQKVGELEDKLDFTVIVQEKREEVRDIFTDKDDWVQVDFNTESIVKENEENEAEWQVQKPNSKGIDFDSVEVIERDLSSEFYLEDYDNESDHVITAEEDELSSELDLKEDIISHTLIDLYYSQGHIEKSISLLKEILKNHPQDEITLNKLSKFNSELEQNLSLDAALDSVDESKLNIDKVERLNKFLELIKIKAKEYESSRY